jgi:hypothetical protein
MISQLRIASFSSSVPESEEGKWRVSRTRALAKLRNRRGAWESLLQRHGVVSAQEQSLSSFPPRHRIFPNLARQFGLGEPAQRSGWFMDRHERKGWGGWGWGGLSAAHLWLAASVTCFGLLPSHLLRATGKPVCAALLVVARESGIWRENSERARLIWHPQWGAAVKHRWIRWHLKSIHGRSESAHFVSSCTKKGIAAQVIGL